MPRVKRYIDTDVLTEAKKRLHHIFDLFDTVVVMFSGGKDSLAVLHLAREVMLERGITGPLDVVFRDEELIPQGVVDFVDGYRRQAWVRMVWFTVPLANEKFILGRTYSYVQWDPGREWVRAKPAWGESLAAGDRRVFDQYSMDGFTAQRYAGKIAFLTGIRASESLHRLRACINKLNENYINQVADPAVRNVNLCKPIFDWEENDVFRFFYDRGIQYCRVYDEQMWAGVQLRVSTPLHAERAKRFDKLRATDPTLYAGVIRVFPEMLTHERYFREWDRETVHERYGTYEGVREWIDEHITDAGQHRAAMKMYEDAMTRARQNPHSYPARHMLMAFLGGNFSKQILPIDKAAQRRAVAKAARA